MNDRKILANISNLYKRAGLLTRLHILVRLKTCPFLIIERYLPKKGLIIDYGCGQGIFSHILSLLSPERKIHGIDLSESKIKEAQKPKRSDRNLQFSADCNISGLLKSVSGVAIIDVLSYLPHQERLDLLKMFYEKLEPGAVLVIKDQNQDSRLKFPFLYLQEFLAVKVLRITESKGLYFFGKDYLRELLGNIGFSVETLDISRGYLYPHQVFICKKS